jgi:L-fuconate dehydratase
VASASEELTDLMVREGRQAARRGAWEDRAVAGGVGLCELVQHLSAFDYVAVSGSLDDVVVEYVDHLHEHFVDPVRAPAGRYLAPEAPGYSAEMRRSSLEEYRFPDGAAWAPAATRSAAQ